MSHIILVFTRCSYYRYYDRANSKAKGSREFSPALLELCNNDPTLTWNIEKKRTAGDFLIYDLRLCTAADADLPSCLKSLQTVSAVAGGHVWSTLGIVEIPFANLGLAVDMMSLPNDSHFAGTTVTTPA